MRTSLGATITFVFLGAASRPATGQIEREWAIHYDSPGRGWEDMKAMAVDPDGNTYLAGSTDPWSVDTHQEKQGVWKDFIVFKVDAKGEVRWVRRHDGAAHDTDAALVAALDPRGGVAVAGTTSTADGLSSTVLRYDQDGNEVSRTDLDFGEPGEHTPMALQVDSRGDAVVAVRSFGQFRRTPSRVAKCSREGALLWTAVFPGMDVSDLQVPTALAINPEGNVYVTGYLDYLHDGTPVSYLTVKLDSSGKEIWQARLERPHDLVPGFEDRPNALALDLDGGVVVTGSYGARFGTVKYDRDGVEIWFEEYAGKGRAAAEGVAIDGEGRVIVTGEDDPNEFSSDVVTIAYDGSGSTIWDAHHLFDVTRIEGIAVAKDGDIVVGGTSWGCCSGTAMAIRYNASGIELFTALRGPPIGEAESIKGIGLDGAGNVYLGGTWGLEGTPADGLVLKIDGSGEAVWTAHLDGPGNGYDFPRAMAFDAEGNAYVTGFRAENGPRGAVGATWKYDPRGELLWIAEYQGFPWTDPQAEDTSGMQVAVDPSGQVVVAAATFTDAELLGYDFEGNLLWKHKPDPFFFLPNMHLRLALDAAGNSYVSGERFSLYKCGGQGTFVWRADLPDEKDFYHAAASMAVDAAGNAAITGTAANRDFSAHESAVLTVRFRPDGSIAWQARESGSDNPIGAAVAVDMDGNTMALGVGSEGHVLFKYDGQGKRLWAATEPGRSFPGGYVGTWYLTPGPALVLDAEGNAYVSGTIDRDGRESLFTSKYDQDGKRLWRQEQDDPNVNVVWPGAVAVDKKGDVFVSGTLFTGRSSRIATILYSSDGEKLGEGFLEEDKVNRLEASGLDGQGNYYVAGISGPIGRDQGLLLVKYTQAARFLRGDCNGDGAPGALSDAIFLIDYGFLGGERPGCLAACDADGDGEPLPVTDAIYLIGHAFLGGPPPPEPFPRCGRGSTSSLTCAMLPGC